MRILETVLTDLRSDLSQIRRYQGRRHHQSGVTLIELIAAIVILAIALVGITAAVSSAISRSSDTTLEARAVALAQSYLDEILARRFDENSGERGIPPCFIAGPANPNGLPDCSDTLGPESGETPVAPTYSRNHFNDVDDYHGLDEGYGQPRPLLDADGVERIGYDNFRVAVAVRYVDVEPGGDEESLTTAPGGLEHTQDAKLVTVTVSHPERPQGWQFSAYKANF